MIPKAKAIEGEPIRTSPLQLGESQIPAISPPSNERGEIAPTDWHSSKQEVKMLPIETANYPE
jgi:hypothetical protein